MIEERIIKPGLMKRMTHEIYPIEIDLLVPIDEYSIPDEGKITDRDYSGNYDIVRYPGTLMYDKALKILTSESRSKLDIFKSKFTKIRLVRVQDLEDCFKNLEIIRELPFEFDYGVTICIPNEIFTVPDFIISRKRDDNYTHVDFISRNRYFNLRNMSYNEIKQAKEFIDDIFNLLSNQPNLKENRYYNQLLRLNLEPGISRLMCEEIEEELKYSEMVYGED